MKMEKNDIMIMNVIKGHVVWIVNFVQIFSPIVSNYMGGYTNNLLYEDMFKVLYVIPGVKGKS